MERHDRFNYDHRLKDEIAMTVWLMVGLHVGMNNPVCYPEERLRGRLAAKLATLEIQAAMHERGRLTRQWLADELEALMEAGSPRIPWREEKL